jgi:hypothetical protein
MAYAAIRGNATSIKYSALSSRQPWNIGALLTYATAKTIKSH